MMHIKIEVPEDNQDALQAAANFFFDLATKSHKDAESCTKEESKVEPPQTAPLPNTTPAATKAPPQTATPPQPSQSADLDAQGIPWDGRIHNGNKNKIKATGCWQLRRGYNTPEKAEYVNSVIAELKGNSAPPPQEEEGPITTPPPGQSVPPPAQGTLPPPVTESRADQVKRLGLALNTFAEVLVATLKVDPAITNDEKTEAAQKLGISGVPELHARPELIPAFVQLLELV